MVCDDGELCIPLERYRGRRQRAGVIDIKRRAGAGARHGGGGAERGELGPVGNRECWSDVVKVKDGSWITERARTAHAAHAPPASTASTATATSGTAQAKGDRRKTQAERIHGISRQHQPAPAPQRTEPEHDATAVRPNPLRHALDVSAARASRRCQHTPGPADTQPVPTATHSAQVHSNSER